MELGYNKSIPKSMKWGNWKAIASQKLENGGRKVEKGHRNPENGEQELENGDLETGRWYPEASIWPCCGAPVAVPPKTLEGPGPNICID